MFKENIRQLSSNNILLKVGFNTGIQISGKIISVAFGVFTVLLLTRYLGTSGYGNFTLAFTYVSFFAAIADFGLQLAMVKELSQKNHGKKELGTFLLLKVSLVALSTLLASILLFTFPYPYEIKIGILIAIIAVAISGISSFGNVILQSKIRLDLITVVDLITKIITVTLIIFFVYLRLNYYFIVFSVLLGNLVGAVIIFILIKDSVYFLYDFRLAKKILLISLPIGISSFLSLAYFKVDTIMLSVMKSSNDVGLYSIAYKILENLLLLWGFYMASVYPLLAILKGNSDKKKLNNIIMYSFFIAVIASILIILIGMFFAPTIIDIFGGKNFHEAIPSLRILLYAIPFLFINNLFYNVLIIHKRNTSILIGMSLSLLINIILNLYFIPKSGFIGASYVTVASAALLSIYYCIRTMKLRYFAI